MDNVLQFVSFRPSEASGEIRIPQFRGTDPSTPLRSGRDDILNGMTLPYMGRPGFGLDMILFQTNGCPQNFQRIVVVQLAVTVEVG
jgi:hypothetical protein